MNDNRKIDLQRFVRPKTKWTYLLKFVAYALVIGIILLFISNRLKSSEHINSTTETKEIRNIKIEVP
ncbi:MAG: hypothetical protein LW688_01635 [Cryomorphaceae bacterium]|nr:hypothetical protein [Cryomorphaceae bacterium]